MPENRPLRVLLAFDSFKGSLSATEACAAVAEALAERWPDRVETTIRPMADGGEGSLELLRLRCGLDAVMADAVDAVGRPLRAEYLLDPSRDTAYIEVASAAGLPQVSDLPLRPLEASSYGVGLLARHALERGARRIVLFLGGSACSDGGAGLLRALGARPTDASGEELTLGGGALAELHDVDASGIILEALLAEWSFVSDIRAPLLGPRGAARCYAPQKGATPGDVERLERALARAAEVLSALTGDPVGDEEGHGAAGGMAVFPSALLRTRMVPGGPFLAEELGVAAAVGCADLVLTGEGRFDRQSVDGKVVGTLAALAAGVEPAPPVIVLAGDVSRAPDPGSGVTAAFALADGPAGLQELQERAAELLGALAVNVVAAVLAGRGADGEGSRPPR